MNDFAGSVTVYLTCYWMRRSVIYHLGETENSGSGERVSVSIAVATLIRQK